MTGRGEDLVREDPGDASAVLRVYARWAKSVPEVAGSPTGPALCHVWRDEEGKWQLALSVQRGKRRQRHFLDVDPDNTRKDRWGLMKLAPGVWDLPQSVLVPDQIHAFVTLVEVPDPAPWER